MLWFNRQSSGDDALPRKNSFMAYAQQHSNHFGGGLDAATSPTHLVSTMFNAILATALFRCWHILVFFIGWATMVTLINERVTSLTFQATLLTVVGTVLGFVVSYRTTSSFERYNEGRRYWSQIILASRTLARAVWFHIPELPPMTPVDEKEGRTEEERRARNLVEKKTVINLIEAFSVAVKHYLRGEEGINYVDLYHLVKFLPSYAFPAGVVPSELEATANMARTESYEKAAAGGELADNISAGEGRPSVSIEPASPSSGNGYEPTSPREGSSPHITLGIPFPATTKTRRLPRGSVGSANRPQRSQTFMSHDDRSVVLLPAALPPKYSVFDVFPFSMLVKCLARKGKEVKGKKAAKLRAKTVVTTRNVPLEISMYLTSYVASLSARKAIDVPTTNLLIATVNQLTDALTGLERILTTPIPFSYSIHLWLVAIIYNLALPFQIYTTLRWLTIPATGIMSFIFFGFLVAGEEIENPFGYDKNDLNMDHFTHNIIRNELRALTAFPPPATELWAFSPRNDRLFLFADGGDEKSAISVDRESRKTTGAASGPGLTPDEWVRRGTSAMKDALAHAL